MRKKNIIQILLVILILLIFFIVYNKYFKKVSDVNDRLIEKVDIDEGNKLINITYESVDTLGRKYIITAETGKLDDKEPDLIYMSKVSAKIILLDKNIIYIESLKAKYNNLNYDTKFQDDVKLKFLNHNVVCDNLDISFKEYLLEAYNNLSYKNLDIIMLADKIVIDILTKKYKIFNFNKSKVKIKKKNLIGNY